MNRLLPVFLCVFVLTSVAVSPRMSNPSQQSTTLVQFGLPIKTKTNNKTPPSPRPHTHKATCALGEIRSGFTHGILAPSHFQIATSRGHAAQSQGLGGQGGTGWRSPPVPFLIKYKLSTETYAIPFLISLYSSYLWVILHTYPQCDIRLLKWYNPIS